MWLVFKKYLILFILLAPHLLKGQHQEGIIYNLKQNWVQYNVEAESFMPAISQAAGSSVSFLVDGDQFFGKKLYIHNTKQVHLFFENILLAKLDAGDHLFDLDSLLLVTQSVKPLLTLYGSKVKTNLATFVVSPPFKNIQESTEEAHLRNKSFTSFFIIVSILLLIGLILIKFNSHDLFNQYANFSRAFNFTTIDEMIYKGGFFVNPSIQLVAWMSFSAGLVLYLLMVQLNIQLIEISWTNRFSIIFHIVQLSVLAIGFLLLFVLRYLIVAAMAYVFNMSSIKNIHFATHVRLTFYLLLFLQVIITLSYFSILPISTLGFLTIIFGSLFTIIVLIGIRLSFIVRHPFVQLFLYLCGTEIFLFIFVFKLVVG